MAPAADLLNWQERRAAEELEHRRKELRERIENLKPHAHRRVALEERLRQLTEEALKLEAPNK